jgi:type I restriction enzyme R subunit
MDFLGEMMTNITEDSIEQNLIEMLVAKGWEYHHGTSISPHGTNPKREGLSSVVLEEEFKSSLKRLNPTVPQSARTEAYNVAMHVGSSDMMASNEKFHNMLTDGVTVEYFKDGNSKGIDVKLVDFDNTQNNSFFVVNQFTIKENNQEKRLDVVLFVNGLPFVVVELKNALDEKATLHKAYTQIQNYKRAVPSIFAYNALTVVSDGLDARVSSLSAPFSRYLAWKSPKKAENAVLPELQIMAERMLDKEVLLSLVRFNTVFESEEMKDEKTGLFSLVKVKKVAAYHQYYAVQKAIGKTIEAIQDNHKIGVVWHTQGSGKSLSMVFYAGQLVVHPQMKNPTIVILTDRNDLDDQLFSTFSNCKTLLRQTPEQAKNREHLKELLKVSGGGVVFATIQKFAEGTGELSHRDNIVVVADEAHRSQYGFEGKLDKKTAEIKYGNAKYLRDALPEASFIGFTGTPIEKEDRSTPAVFGEYIDVYDIAQAVIDGATVPISYESRLVKIKLNKEVSDKIDALVDDIEGATDEQIENAKSKNAQINAILGHPDRVKDVAADIVEHFSARQALFEGKGMIVCMTRQITVDLYAQIVALQPKWHSDQLDKGKIKVVMTSTSDDPESFQMHATTKKERKRLSSRIKDSRDELELVIVQSMWLTGFDCPPMHTMYVDKKMQGANLMQAIARVNRVYKDKPGGLVVDYIGIGQDLKNAMAVYVEAGGEGKAVLDMAEVIAGMLSKFEIVEQMFHAFSYKAYFTAKTGDKLKILMATTNYLLSDEKLKERFVSEVTVLSKLYVMSVPSVEAENIRDSMAFFQALKVRINKFTPRSGKSDIEVDTAIKQIVDDALTTDGVINIFDEVGIQAPSLDILSDEFLMEVKGMEHKNLAIELLKKLLNEEVKIRKQKSLVQGKKFSEMLENVIHRYHNNQITTAEVIEALSNLAKEMRLEDNKAVDLGLTPEEYAFYQVLNENDSTSFLEDDIMKELIHHIVEAIRKNATVDWEKRDDVKAKLRLMVKKILMKYGYPPDLAKMEADRVLAQSEKLAYELTKG